MEAAPETRFRLIRLRLLRSRHQHRLTSIKPHRPTCHQLGIRSRIIPVLDTRHLCTFPTDRISDHLTTRDERITHSHDDLIRTRTHRGTSRFSAVAVERSDIFDRLNLSIESSRANVVDSG